MARAARDGAPRSVALLDLDRFKQFNDRHGHPAGDRLLADAAAAWAAAVRSSDLLARFGGEEFVLLLSMTGEQEAVGVVEALRSVAPQGQRFSCGIATLDGVGSAAGLLARADAALYAAKNGGRNRTEVAGNGIGQPSVQPCWGVELLESAA